MTTKTTFHLSLSRRAQIRVWLSQRDPATLVAPLTLALLCLLIGIGLARALVRPSESTASAQPTQAPIMIIATARAQALPSAVPTATPRLITAYDQPNGTAFPDPIPAPDPSQWIARWGNTWIEVTWQPNPVWIQAAAVGAVLTDIATASDPQIRPVLQPPAAEPAYQVTNADPAVPTRLYGMTDADMDRALAEHQRQELAWCADQQSAYCDLVRASVQP